MNHGNPSAGNHILYCALVCCATSFIAHRVFAWRWKSRPCYTTQKQTLHPREFRRNIKWKMTVHYAIKINLSQWREAYWTSLEIVSNARHLTRLWCDVQRDFLRRCCCSRWMESSNPSFTWCYSVEGGLWMFFFIASGQSVRNKDPEVTLPEARMTQSLYKKVLCMFGRALKRKRFTLSFLLLVMKNDVCTFISTCSFNDTNGYLICNFTFIHVVFLLRINTVSNLKCFLFDNYN